jgi:hypothetical protein
VMRIGESPVRVKRVHVRPRRVTVCMVVCIPHQLDYYSHRLDVLQLSLASLRAQTPRDAYTLMVLDNNSSPAVVEFLRGQQRDGQIDQLILSAHNIGKIHACRMLFDAAPGDIVAYADDDVWFGPGWLDAQLQVLEAFPRVGMVSGRPVRKQFLYGNTGLADYLSAYPDVSRTVGHFIPDEWEREYLHSTGRGGEAPATVEEVRLECDGVMAYSTATHFQFIAPKPVIAAALAQCGGPRIGSEERQFEEAVEAMGYVRLSTVERYVHHIGNVVSKELRERATASMPVNAAAWQPSSPAWVRLARTRLGRALLSRINRWSYFLLHHP